MAGAASAHQAATTSREQSSQQRASRTRRTSADPQRDQQGATAAAADAPAALNSLSRLQQLADASPQVAQLRRLQALANARFAPVAQLAGGPEEEELVHGKFATAQLQPQLQQAARVNNTGLPDQLKSGIESLSGLSLDHVRVHYNSPQPAQLNALAYAQGSDIHLAPGQEQHLPHETWHVVQQAQGRVLPTLQMKDGVVVNDDVGLEREADVMGGRALRHPAQLHSVPADVSYLPKTAPIAASITSLIQCFRDTNGTEVDAHKLTPSQIETYPATPGLGSSAYIELRQAHRAKQHKMGFDESAARRKRVEAADDRNKKSRAAEVELRRMGKTVNNEPAFEFYADDEKHTIYLGSTGGQPVLMIASHPLPVGAFILELEQRFNKLYTEYTANKNKALKGGDTKLQPAFTVVKNAAGHQLVITNGVFANVTSTVKEKLNSERDLSKALHPLIHNVNNFAKRLDNHFSEPGKGKVVRAGNFYTQELSGVQECYNIEGLVSTYETQPDYPGSGFERDHQPHNDIIDAVASLPDFKGKEVCRVAKGRTKKGWSILLHHNRHAAGRTFGAKGGQVTTAFKANWAGTGSKLPTPNDRCKWVIAELKKSLTADVAAMKDVANNTAANYKDVDELGLAPDATASLKDKIKAQILNGEDRLAGTAELIDKWDEKPQ